MEDTRVSRQLAGGSSVRGVAYRLAWWAVWLATSVGCVEASATVGSSHAEAGHHLDTSEPDGNLVGTEPLVKDSGRLAPGDDGPVDQHHLWTLGTEPEASVFCWVPVFRAWQVMDPQAAGLPDLPVGAWVGRQPDGSEGQAWATEVLGDVRGEVRGLPGRCPPGRRPKRPRGCGGDLGSGEIRVAVSGSLRCRLG